MKPIIVGVDPGTTTAYAILDSRGRMIKMDSSKFFDLNTLISEVIKYGNPMMVGCDKSPAPRFVERFATKVGAKLVFPGEDLLKEEKKQMVDVKTRNDHESDAYASAIHAFKQHEDLYRRVDSTLENLGKLNLAEELKYLVTKEGLNIQESLNYLEKIDEEKEEGVRVRLKVVRPKREIKELQKEVVLMEEKNQIIQQKLVEVENQNRKLKRRIKGIPVDKIVKQKEAAILKIANKLEAEEERADELNQELDHLKSFIANSPNRMLAKKLKNFSQKEFKDKNWMNIVQGDVLLVDDPNIISKKVLSEMKEKVHIVVHRAKLKSKIPGFTFVNAKNLDMEEISDFALIDKKQMGENLSKEDLLRKVVSEYKKKRPK